MQRKSKRQYGGFTMIEMLITMAVLTIIFLAVGSLVNNMIKASNTVSSRMLVREESEYFAEIIRKYIRNSRIDNVKLYVRDAPKLSFDDKYEVTLSSGQVREELVGEESFTEIHFQSNDQKSNKVTCIGYFKDAVDPNRGYLVKSVGDFVSWESYEPGNCFSLNGNNTPMFRKNFVVLNTDLISVEGGSVTKEESSQNIYYSIDIDVRPVWGLGGMSNYRNKDGAPVYRKSFVVQTRRVSSF